MYYVFDYGAYKRANKKKYCAFEYCLTTNDLRDTLGSLIEKYYDIPEGESIIRELMYNVSTLDGYRTLASDYEIEIYTLEKELTNRIMRIVLEGKE